MIEAGLKVSSLAWNVAFMRQTAAPMDSGEWEAWLEEMELGHHKLSPAALSELRATCTTRAIMTILAGAPDVLEQCQDAWRAIRDLMAKVEKTDWFAALETSFQDEFHGLQSMIVVGCDMHHSTEEFQGKADAFKKRLQSQSSKSATAMHFAKVLSQSSAGTQLSVAVCEVLAAQEKVSGWTDDLKGAMDILHGLPQIQQDAFLNKDHDITIPSASKLADMQAKLGSLLQSSTDKFQQDHKGDFVLLKRFQSDLANYIKVALAHRVFGKVPGLANAISWCLSGCSKQSDAEKQAHLTSIGQAKNAVTCRTQFLKHVGADYAKSLADFIGEFQKFLVSLEGFISWLEEAEDVKSSGSLSVFQNDRFRELIKYFNDCDGDAGGSSQKSFAFSLATIHADGPAWTDALKSWLAKWSQERVIAKLSSCKDFVGLVMEEGCEIQKVCVETVTGTVDMDEDTASIRTAVRELSSIACTVCFHADLKKAFDFGDITIDLESLCATNIYLPVARHSAALISLADKLLGTSNIQSGTVEELKQPGSSRTENAFNLLGMLKRWVEARIWFFCGLVQIKIH